MVTWMCYQLHTMMTQSLGTRIMGHKHSLRIRSPILRVARTVSLRLMWITTVTSISCPLLTQEVLLLGMRMMVLRLSPIEL